MRPKFKSEEVVTVRPDAPGFDRYKRLIGKVVGVERSYEYDKETDKTLEFHNYIVEFGFSNVSIPDSMLVVTEPGKLPEGHGLNRDRDKNALIPPGGPPQLSKTKSGIQEI